MGFQNQNDLIAGLINGQRFNIFKASQTSEGAGTWHSLWKAIGSPAAGANPPAFTAGSGYTPTRTTTGAVPFTNPANPKISALGRLGLAGATVGALTIYDRLWACSGFDTTVTTAQNVTTPGNLPSGRDPNTGGDVEPWLEVYTAPGATGATWTLTGVDGAGNTGRTWTYTHPANAESVGQMAPFVPGTAAVLGCRQVTSLTCSVSSGTAGSVGITLLRRLADIPLTAANIEQVLDAYGLGLPQVFDDSCLAFLVLCSATNTGIIQGLLSLPQN